MWLHIHTDIACDLWLVEEEEKEMAKLTMAERKKLPKSDFAVPSKAPGPGSYPITDKKHAAVAKSYGKRFASSGEMKSINKKANKKLGTRKKV